MWRLWQTYLVLIALKYFFKVCRFFKYAGPIFVNMINTEQVGKKVYLQNETGGPKKKTE